MTISTRTVSDDEADIRLGRWFRRHFPGVPQSAIQKLCRTGQLRVDGKRAEAATRLASGQAVRIPPLPAAPEARPAHDANPGANSAAIASAAREIEAMTLYQDDHLMVLDKPYGLSVQGGPGITRHIDGMLEGLRNAQGERPRLVHRLDRDTTGVLLIARTPGVAAKLAAAFRGRDMDKTYWAVVAGRPVPVEGQIDLPLKRVGGAQGGGERGERTAPAERDDEDAARAITEYRTLDHAARKLAWLELKPLTGRTHQLRVHCVAIRAPILGDVKYARPDQNNAFAAIVAGLPEKLHLHARSLVFPHPAGGRMRVEAELPPHMRETFQTLGFTAPSARPPHREGR